MTTREMSGAIALSFIWFSFCPFPPGYCSAN